MLHKTAVRGCRGGGPPQAALIFVPPAARWERQSAHREIWKEEKLD